MRYYLRSTLVLSVLVMGVVACREGNAPADQPHSYQLLSYGGSAPPVTLRRIVETSTQPGGPTTYCDDKLTASSLQLLATARFGQTDSHVLVCDDGRADAPSQEVLQGTYTTHADTLVLSADVGSGAQYLSFGLLGSSGVTIFRREARITGGATSIDPTSLVYTSATN